MLVMANIDGTMSEVDAGVDRLDGSVDWISLLVASNDVVAHLQGNDLLEVEHVLDDDNTAKRMVVGRLLSIKRCRLLLLRLTQFGNTDTNAKLLATLRTLEHERLTSGIAGLIESYVVVAFRTADTLHGKTK